MTTVNATDLLNMLITHSKVISKTYEHIKLPFKKSEVQDFLNGDTGKALGHTNRSHQVVQAVSAIGALLVDQKIAPPSTVVTYQALWAMEKKQTCKYCNKPFTIAFMMSNRSKVCHKAKCNGRNA